MTHPTAFDQAVARVRTGASADDEARALHAQLTEDERLWLLDGDTEFWRGLQSLRSGGFNVRSFVHGEVPRLGIPGLRFADGPRGCVIGPTTCFPVSTARGATFDVALEEEVGDRIGREVRAAGANLYGGVCVNLPRHPAWGRAQEVYGDEPLHLGEFGAALTRGVQKHAMATVKHFALNSMENARFTVDVTVDEQTLHDVYLPHFKRVIDEGVAAVMSAYNSVNGEWCGQHPGLLTDVLREQWGFAGITISDWVWGLRDAAASVEAGLDLEMPFRQLRARDLAVALEDGRTSWKAVVRAGTRLLAAQLTSYATRSDEPPVTPADSDARALARSVAARSMVLLRNEPVGGDAALPLDPTAVRRIAVIGRLAVAANTGDKGSSDVRLMPATSTPATGVAAAFPTAHVSVVIEDDPAAAAAAAAEVDVAVVVVGFTAEDEGEFIGGDVASRPELVALYPPPPPGVDVTRGRDENVDSPLAASAGGDRVSLSLRPVDERIVQAVAAANPRTIVALVASGPVLMEEWRDAPAAILYTWYAGMEGGAALGDVLSGRAEPTGRLPFSIPTHEDHLPHFDRAAKAVTYERLHGQRLLDALRVPAAFPYGFGLGYTTWRLEGAAVTGPGQVDVLVRNSGARDGRHVVQVYGRRLTGEHDGEVWLLGFLSVAVEAGCAERVTVPFSLEPLALWSKEARTRMLPSTDDVELIVASHRHDVGSVRPTHSPAPDMRPAPTLGCASLDGR
jgi:beta-glucosidase